MAGKETLWPLEPHTVGKHLVLKAYLDAWLPIMGMTNERILFIDGFAGPGEYEDGSPGSPLIALDAFINHRHRHRLEQEIVFIFIEKDIDRFGHLKKVISERYQALPGRIKILLYNDAFDNKLNEVLDEIEIQKKTLAPCFAMIDPFGVSDTPISVIKRILANPKSEVFVSLMYSFMNRFKASLAFEKPLDLLFGSEKWRKCLSIADASERRGYIFDLYKDTLYEAGASNVLSFDLFREGYHVYSIFFATKSLIGCDKMKQALWKVHPSGDFAFFGHYGTQMEIGVEAPDYSILKRQLLDEFSGRGWVSIKKVTDFVRSDKTHFHSGQLKTSTLKPMEVDGALKVDESSRNRKWTYPDGVSVQFLRTRQD